MSSGDWRELSRGREAFATLTHTFANGAELQRRIETLLGATPKDVAIMRYEGRGQRRAAVTATEKTPWGGKHVACVTREDGTILETFVSRGGSA
jgi:hypothetical protein